MHYLQSAMEPTLVAAPPTTSKILPESRHLDIPWKEFVRRNIIKTTCAATPFNLDSTDTLSARDTYILSLHARSRHIITPRGNRTRLPPSRSFSLPASTIVRSPSTTLGPRTIGKRFKKQGNAIRLQKAVLMKNSFEAAARDYDARGDGFAAEKQRKRAKLPQRYIDKIAEQDDPRMWTFPPSRRAAASRSGCLPTQKSTLASVSFCDAMGIRL